ncbi:MAG TPA: hypothetical protein VGO35_01690 [Gammaproteobacteria bacterium]|jgi:hypothetical protein|nr:hypothetical protein [Gammaproteobacteria bacterium]
MLRLSAFMLMAASCAASATDIIATPEIFSPGVISGPAHESSISFMPDGKTAFFDRGKPPNASVILVSHKVDGAWSEPTIAPFSGTWLDHDPVMAPDGSYLVFASNRPGASDKPEDKGGLWRVDRKGEGWGEPWRLPQTVNASSQTYAPSIAGDGSLYFIRFAADGSHIFRSQYKDGNYQEAVQQALGEAGAHPEDPAIAPDESFVVFGCDDPAKPDAPDRLFIAFREGDHWGKPTDLGDAINADSKPSDAHLGPDGRTLYYSSSWTSRWSYPRTPAQAEQDLARMDSWDDGVSNIWSVSLAPWLDGHAAKP